MDVEVAFVLGLSDGQCVRAEFVVAVALGLSSADGYVTGVGGRGEIGVQLLLFSSSIVTFF